MGLATLIVSIVALLVSGWAVVDGRRSARKANHAAERSAAAAERQVELATPPEVAFRIDWVRGDFFALTNSGTAIVTGVAIDSSQFVAANDLPNGLSLAPGQAVDFFAVRPPASVQVRCDQRHDLFHVPVPPRR